jgi:uncharacterized membrane protein YeaQ/YmgE (transglycosylase-associated protein family)
MIDILGFQIGITWLGVTALVFGALILGLIGQFLGEVRTRYEWLADAVAAFLGAFVASESLGTFSTQGPEWEGIFIGPALIGAVVLTFLVDLVVRWGTGGSFTGHAHPA